MPLPPRPPSTPDLPSFVLLADLCPGPVTDSGAGLPPLLPFKSSDVQKQPQSTTSSPPGSPPSSTPSTRRPSSDASSPKQKHHTRRRRSSLLVSHNHHTHSHKHDSGQHTTLPRDSALCCGPIVPLYERMFTAATVTTMEQKYTVTRFIAEFYCTLTSPFFALPLIIYLFVPWSAIPPLQHACIAGSCLAAFVSTLYHCTLWKVFSSADAAVATITFYLNAISLNRHAPQSHPLLHHELTWLITVFFILCVFAWHWERTHHLSTTLVLICFPAAVFGFYALESYVGLGTGVVGLLCFAVDRRGVACLHSVWHILGGLSLLFGIWDACLAADKMQRVGLVVAGSLAADIG
ncbi:hypothetical protein PhCBS80983_g01345 [Powellomyces hirtus]|uniref:Uncharacterized protein n=1 Tax=Powellomyces hirtus TaxID=109895 RepID=A0A507EAK2_9FUNG|nr:hypothetical protein PhCBS80983_g01345 [Powellomyces hirtus]